MRSIISPFLQVIVLTPLVIFSVQTAIATDISSGPTVEISGPELFWHETAAVPEVEVRSSSEESDISELLTAEHQRASYFLKRLEVQDSFVARLVVNLPIVVEEVTEDVTESVAELQEKVVEQVERIAEKVTRLEETRPDVAELDRLPLSELTADASLMKRAKVSFDEATDTWLAVWKKPAVFHFGMILHPELLDRVQEGEKLHFESKGMKLALVRSGENKLMVEQVDGKQHELGAKRLEGLLRRSITVDGLDLFLDAGGNLILRAAGEQARSLAARLGSS